MATERRELLANATPRPWKRRTWRAPAGGHGTAIVRTDNDAVIAPCWPHDADLIVQAVNDYEALLDVADAARLIQAYHDAGGNEWWDAHDKLYAALARLDTGDQQ